MTEPKLSVVFEFTETGYLKAVLLNAEREKDEVTLERSLERLFKPDQCHWIKKLFKKR